MMKDAAKQKEEHGYNTKEETPVDNKKKRHKKKAGNRESNSRERNQKDGDKKRKREEKQSEERGKGKVSQLNRWDVEWKKKGTASKHPRRAV